MKAAIGQDSHAFEAAMGKPCVLGGAIIPGERGLLANSDGDVVLHALTNAISGISGVNILGKPADELCQRGIKDSREYVKLALSYLKAPVTHVSFTLECAHPRLAAYIPAMRESVGALLGLAPEEVGITATTGEGLTAFGQGLGISVFCILTVGEEHADC